MPRSFRVGKSADHEFFASHRFGFNPIVSTSAGVRPIASLGDNAFEAHAAGFGKERLTVSRDVFGVADHTSRSVMFEQIAENCLALVEWRRAQVMTVEVRQVESIVDQLALAIGLKGILQCLK